MINKEELKQLFTDLGDSNVVVDGDDLVFVVETDPEPTELRIGIDKLINGKRQIFNPGDVVFVPCRDIYGGTPGVEECIIKDCNNDWYTLDTWSGKYYKFGIFRDKKSAIKYAKKLDKLHKDTPRYFNVETPQQW